MNPRQKRARVEEVGQQINAHLKRFEADPEINAVDPKRKTRPFYQAGAWVHCGKVSVVYIGYWGSSRLTLEDAERYLEWLDTGNVGRHYEALREVEA